MENEIGVRGSAGLLWEHLGCCLRVLYLVRGFQMICEHSLLFLITEGISESCLESFVKQGQQVLEVNKSTSRTNPGGFVEAYTIWGNLFRKKNVTF